MSEQYKTDDDEIEIDLQELFGLILHRLWLIILVGLLTGGIGFGISKYLMTPMYQSTTRVYILNSSDNNNGNITLSDTQLASTLTKDYEALITSRFVLEKVIEDMQLDLSYGALKERVTVSNASNTRIIDISVKAEQPEYAQAIADAIRIVSAEQIQSVMNIEAVNLVDAANLPLSKCEPSVSKYTLIGFAAGAFLVGIIVVIIYLLDDTIKTSEDVEKYLGLSTLALIPDTSLEEKEDKKKGKHRNSSSQSETRANKTEELTSIHSGVSAVVIKDLEDEIVKEGAKEDARH